MYKIIAFDLDGTLFNDDHLICERNKLALQQAKEKGVRLVPCSGRGVGYLGDLIQQLDLHTNEDYSILGNGAIIVTNKDQHILHCDELEIDVVSQLITYAYVKKVNVQVFTPHQIFVYFCDKRERQRIQTFQSDSSFLPPLFIDELDLQPLDNQIAYKMVFQIEDMDYLRSLQDDVEKIGKQNLTITYSCDRYLEINVKGTGKGSGLQHLAKHLGISMEETIGIGDSYNDTTLIQDAQIGAAMANAVAEIKAIADYQCTRDNNQGGVAEVIEKFIL